jgi:hypothetical protein
MKGELLLAHAYLTDQGKRNTYEKLQTVHSRTNIPDLRTYESRTFQIASARIIRV